MNYGVLKPMDLTKILVHDMGISHRNLNTGMAKQFLNVHDICIIAKKIRSKRVSKRVRMDIFI